jgi:hypothetical protein
MCFQRRRGYKPFMSTIEHVIEKRNIYSYFQSLHIVQEVATGTFKSAGYIRKLCNTEIILT